MAAAMVVSEKMSPQEATLRLVMSHFSEVSVDGSGHKAPCGGEGSGKSPCDRAKSGWKWSLAVDRAGHPRGLGHRRDQPSRQHLVRTHPRSCR